MTITLFISIIAVGGAGVTAILTEAIKTWYRNAGKDYSPNAIALINAFVVGGCGTAVVYMLNGIEWSVNNIICLILAIFAEWLISMVGFDKVSQTMTQIATIAVKRAEEKAKENEEPIVFEAKNTEANK